MKPILSEKNLVVFLFAMVLIMFAIAQEDSKKKLPGMRAGKELQAAKKTLVQQTKQQNNTIPGMNISGEQAR